MPDWIFVNDLEILMRSLAVGAVAFYLVVRIGAALARKNSDRQNRKWD